MKKCNICGKDYDYVIANPIGEGEVFLCEEHYYHLKRAEASAFRQLIEHKFFVKTGEN
jgi:hypothetical protein